MNSIDIQTVHKKPFVAYVLQFLTAYIAVIDGLSAIAVFFLFQSFSLMTLVGTFLISLIVSAISVRVFLGLGRMPFKKRSTVSIYLWGMLFLYPVINVLRSFDAYTPAQHIENNQLLGAAIFEFGRYIFYIILIIWVGFSKRLKDFLSNSSPLTTQSR